MISSMWSDLSISIPPHSYRLDLSIGGDLALAKVVWAPQNSTSFAAAMDDGRIELWDLAEKPLGKLRSMTTKGRCSEGATASAGETISWDTQKVALLRNLSVLRSNSFFANCVGIFEARTNLNARMWRHHDMSWYVMTCHNGVEMLDHCQARSNCGALPTGSGVYRNDVADSPTEPNLQQNVSSNFEFQIWWGMISVLLSSCMILSLVSIWRAEISISMRWGSCDSCAHFISVGCVVSTARQTWPPGNFNLLTAKSLTNGYMDGGLSIAFRCCYQQ